MRVASLVGKLSVGTDYLRCVPASKMDQATPSLLDPRVPHNIGDWFVTKIVDRLLDYEELVLIGKDAGDAEWEYVNSECDVLILKGGNYIQANWLAKEFGLDLFKKIRIPIVLFGVGLQAPLGGTVEFEREEAEILRYIHERCACSSVRGDSTAEALGRLGITNAVVTGCPTIYWSRKPHLQVRQPDERSAGFTYRQGLYSSDGAVYRAQFKAIETVRNAFGSVRVLLQGEEVALQHYLQARRWGAEFKTRVAPIPGLALQRIERRAQDAGQLRAEIHRALDPFSSPAFVDWFMNNTFFSYDIAEYLAEYQAHGMVIGCRLHSNLLALAHETPTYYLTYDQRTQELVELFAVPHSPLLDFDEGVDLFSQDWGAFERKYAHYYREMLRFLEANNLAHRLAQPAANAAPGGDPALLCLIERQSRQLDALTAQVERLADRDEPAQRALPQLRDELAELRRAVLVERVQRATRRVVPPDATVVVVSRGDDELVELGDRQGWHFPRTAEGWYAGHHPGDSAEVIAHLEALRDEGGQFLLLPSTAFWWLEYYEGFRQHLDAHYQRVWDDAHCVIYRLAAEPRAARAS